MSRTGTKALWFQHVLIYTIYITSITCMYVWMECRVIDKQRKCIRHTNRDGSSSTRIYIYIFSIHVEHVRMCVRVCICLRLCLRLTNEAIDEESQQWRRRKKTSFYSIRSERTHIHAQRAQRRRSTYNI